MSFWSSAKAVWSATSEGSRALSAAQDAYKAGEPLTGIVKAWSTNTETQVDDKILTELIAGLTLGITWAYRAALLLVKVSIRLEMLPARFVAGVGWLERRIPPVLAMLRAAADRVERSAGITQRLSLIATHLATWLASLKGDA